MSKQLLNTLDILNRDYLARYPVEAGRSLAELPPEEAAAMLTALPLERSVRVWEEIPLDAAERVLPVLPASWRAQLLAKSDPVHMSRLLARFAAEQHAELLAGLDPARVRELEELAHYSDDSAGALMDVRYLTLHAHMTVETALLRLRLHKPRFTRQLFIVDESDRVQSMVEIQEMALADPEARLDTLTKPVPAAVLATSTREDVVDQLENLQVTDLPVVDVNGRLVGVISHDALATAAVEESSADILTMVGASKDERALSPVRFVVRKRLPWLHINLLTAFIAASVVGLFENVIAQFTMLAVLMPMVAGQSGNAGAQALAVTMRSLALHEIAPSQWPRVVRKELIAGFINGLAIAAVTALGVLFWSGSAGLALVIGLSMVIAMGAASFAGVVVPIILSRLGQDPAQASSIILTTITDVTGFLSFLGIASLLASML
jgi:magnesium transporter